MGMVACYLAVCIVHLFLNLLENQRNCGKIEVGIKKDWEMEYELYIYFGM